MLKPSRRGLFRMLAGLPLVGWWLTPAKHGVRHPYAERALLKCGVNSKQLSPEERAELSTRLKVVERQIEAFSREA